jgi:hypothetical protein
MNKITNILFCGLLVLVFGEPSFPQDTKSPVQKPEEKKQDSPKTIPQIKEAGQFNSVIEEMEYYAPIRYVIVYNEIFEKLNERRMDVLLDKKSFNKENLSAIFLQIAKKFPTPLKLTVTVHTSLATIETPEEKQMERDGQDSRFRSKKSQYDDAYFMRVEDGSAVVTFDITLSADSDGWVVLVPKPKR